MKRDSSDLGGSGSRGSSVEQQIKALPHAWHRDVLERLPAGTTIPAHLLKPINYDYRPRSYWLADTVQHLLANIKGAERKKDAKKLLRAGKLDEAYDFLLQDSVSDNFRDFLGGLHPRLMGGEYLPDYEPDEVEIARVTCDSTLQDVTSIRAFPDEDDRSIIRYRAVDEHESEFTFEPQFSRQPLSLGELIKLIDGSSGSNCGIGLDIIQINFECNDQTPDYYLEFLDFSSEFYPDLSKHYWFAVRKWAHDNEGKAKQ